jgi:hypothetical protein
MCDNLSGEWHGTYRYPRGLGPDTPFLATIDDRNGDLSGTIIEPNGLRPETVRATMLGHRAGTSVDFTKTYHQAGAEYATPVDYVGSISDGGRTIAGVWSLLEWDGTFEMFRDAAGGHEVEMAETGALAQAGGPGGNLPLALPPTD